jgi:hypothetical protein
MTIRPATEGDLVENEILMRRLGFIFATGS